MVTSALYVLRLSVLLLVLAVVSFGNEFSDSVFKVRSVVVFPVDGIIVSNNPVYFADKLSHKLPPFFPTFKNRCSASSWSVVFDIPLAHS